MVQASDILYLVVVKNVVMLVVRGNLTPPHLQHCKITLHYYLVWYWTFKEKIFLDRGQKWNRALSLTIKVQKMLVMMGEIEQTHLELIFWVCSSYQISLSNIWVWQFSCIHKCSHSYYPLLTRYYHTVLLMLPAMIVQYSIHKERNKQWMNRKHCFEQGHQWVIRFKTAWPLKI